ncbi:predicted protein [Uncinocarpus reesii 1704]|uniref:HMG box domain-containing protein n=1 Tax=Uncinocarpus reesii (strain UAMH 1704) TaxID=336963 RepID=C4JQW1_UNCRE|nr:uncharacterized protein UREG_03443 [Uncinocarpus reesii 1704]EEP78597.1 predicted protein [Uncinocarpus reesii 1704]
MNTILAHRGPSILRRFIARSPRFVVRTSNDARLALSAVVAGTVAIQIQLRNAYANAATSETHTRRTQTSKTEGKTTKSKANKKKSATKTKAKQKPKKKLTDNQKEALKKKAQRQEIKELKIAALTPPKALANNPFGLVLQQNVGETLAQKIETYRNMSAAERDRLRELAKANTDTNKAAFEQWVKSHTPLQIKEANAARRRLRLLSGRPRSFADIPDPRQVKRPGSAYIIFAKERLNSGEVNHLTANERISHIAENWRKMTQAEQEKYRELQKEASRHYAMQYESVYGESPKHQVSK